MKSIKSKKQKKMVTYSDDQKKILIKLSIVRIVILVAVMIFWALTNFVDAWHVPAWIYLLLLVLSFLVEPIGKKILQFNKKEGKSDDGTV